jgi:protein TonB
MALRCLLFSSDEGTAESIRQVLVGLGVEGEHCSEPADAIERVTNENLQIVIIDWDKQPEAAQLLTTARQRKAAERPLTLAIVSDDASAPTALQAGANSILRKPLQIAQVKDILTTARDLLRAKRDSAASAAQSAHAAAASASSSAAPTFSVVPPSEPQPEEKPRGEFLQPSARSHAPEFVSSLDVVVPEKEMAPVAAAPAQEKPVDSDSIPASTAPPDGPRGLEWYLKTRAGASSSSATAPPPSVPTKPELMGYEAPARPTHIAPAKSIAKQAPAAESKSTPTNPTERKKEAELFAYMADGKDAAEEVPRPKPRLGKPAILGALAVASFAIVAAPQAPWHSQVRGLVARGRQTLHAWLNPQPVTPVQTVAHEDFARAGDEYKLPVGEPIPDATTDPTQIQVLPVVDPTAKKPNSDASNPAQPDGSATPPGDSTPPVVQVQEQPLAPPNGTAQPTTGPTGIPSPPAAAAPVSSPHSEIPAAIPPSLSSPSPVTVAPTQHTPPKDPFQRHASPVASVPSSLQSQLASMTPDASGNKAPETAMASIEPVAVPEAVERALLTEQPAIAYPANVKAQATVVLQVLIGRDGAVQDAKFLQGSLAFARTAIDGVKQWKFKPYSMNGRPVSVQTSLTLTFKPTH